MNWTYLLTSFDGRIGRRAFWLAFLPLLAAEITCYFVAYRMDGERLAAIVELLFTYPEMAVFAKRAHDRNLPTLLVVAFFAFGVFLNFLVVAELGGTQDDPGLLMRVLTLPWLVVALALLIELGLRKGVEGPNQHGPDPAGKI